MRLFILLLALLMASPVMAQTSPEELRARDIGSQLRCVVCQNQSIEESEASLAQDMRKVVREQIADGKSDEQVIAFIRDSYGDYVLLKPPVQPNTYLLWFLPGILVLAGLIWFGLRARRDPSTETATQSLSETDKALLDQLMRDET